MRTLEQLNISPAPWRVGVVAGSDADDLVVFDGKNCAVVLMHELKDYRASDARLVASAPDCLMSLAETLTALKNRLPSKPTLEELEIIDRAEAAIRKATGESEVAK